MGEASVLLLGLVLAIVGGELFVRSAVGIAVWARIPAAVIAATVVAFSTSSPEFAVSTGAAFEGRPEVGLGDALGSNVANIGLVLGMTLTFVGAITVTRHVARRDISATLGAPMLLGVLAVDGRLSRLDGLVLIAAFAVWFALTIAHARRDRARQAELPEIRRRGRAIVAFVLGLACLIAAGRTVVLAAEEIGATLGLDTFIVGATFVAGGTSIPELATSILARVRGHGEIGLGTVLGSNIFNGLLIVGTAATLHPMVVRWSETAVSLGFGIVLVAGVVVPGGRVLSRSRGTWLLGTYLTYVAVLVVTRPAA